jgi:hypothetical protein
LAPSNYPNVGESYPHSGGISAFNASWVAMHTSRGEKYVSDSNSEPFRVKIRLRSASDRISVARTRRLTGKRLLAFPTIPKNLSSREHDTYH